MPRLHAGLVLGRRAIALAVVEERGGNRTLVFDRVAARRELGESVRTALSDVPAHLRRADLRIALSGGDVACDDLWESPQGLKPREVARIAPVLLEARAAGETLEDLSFDLSLEAGRLTAVAVRTELLRTLVNAAGEAGFRVTLVTSIPAALATAFPTEPRIVLAWEGQEIEVKREGISLSWRSRPKDGASGVQLEGSLRDLTPAQAIAFAAATVNPERVPNALRGLPEAPRSFGERCRNPLMALTGTAALLLVSLGLLFRAEMDRLGAEVKDAIQVEADLVRRHFPERKAVRGELLRSVRDKLRDSGVAGAGGSSPSAFLFFADLGKHFPDVEPLGLSIEALDITPDGGRMTAAVLPAPGDPLRNASLLEARLNESVRIAARGDFEIRGNDVQVRLKMDHRAK